MIGGLVLQLILLRLAGFSIASGLLFACTAAGFGKRNLAVTIPIGVGLSLLIYGAVSYTHLDVYKRQVRKLKP